MHKVSRIAVLVSALLPTSLLAASIEGSVKDANGKVIVGATVRVEGTTAETVTDNSGQFVFTDLAEGSNELHISAPGFAHLHQELNISSSHSTSFVLARTPIEVIDIVATPIHMSVMESAAPVSVLAGEELRRQQASSLGDSLEKIVGVQTNFHGNVASTPIIRGLSGPRVMIAQNGLDVSDVSRVGPDHSVASEASTAEQIEVLRGPATLFYGSGAVGGVINVVDGRVPTDNETRGEWLLEANSVDERKQASFNVTTGADAFAFYADGYWRESEDYEVPVDMADEDGEHGNHVENSAEKSNGLTLGTSYLFDQGYVGVSVESFNREYGVPGHSHGDEDVSVYADLEQTKIQLLGEYNIEGDWLKKVKFASGFTDYEHAEIESGEVGTLFENSTKELKLDIIHTAFLDWQGGLSFHYKNSEVAAQGEEAFTPPSDTETFAVALIEEKRFGDVLLQLGARLEHVTLNADNLLLPELEAHGHDEDEGEDDHDHSDSDAAMTQVYSVENEFTPVSLSAGLVWNFAEEYNVGLSLSRSERAPSASELMSFGPHIGTGSYEIGALFAIHEDDEHIGLSEQTIDLETANNIDLTLRKTHGDIGFVLNAFYNKVENYYYQSFTGLYAENGHDHDHDHDHGDDAESTDEHSDELPVYLFRTDDVVLKGFEAQVAWQATDTLKATVFTDYVETSIDGGGYLPRTPPLRVGTQFNYKNEKINAHFDVTHYADQSDVAENETETDGYTLVDASISYDLEILNHDAAVYIKGTNLTDTEARVHTSFIKDVAPRPGRSFAVGIKGYF